MVSTHAEWVFVLHLDMKPNFVLTVDYQINPEKRDSLKISNNMCVMTNATRSRTVSCPCNNDL